MILICFEGMIRMNCGERIFLHTLRVGAIKYKTHKFYLGGVKKGMGKKHNHKIIWHQFQTYD